MPRSARPRLTDAITDVDGIKVGHWTDRRGATGCTVVLCEAGAVPGVDVRGAAPGTRETDLMRPGAFVQEVHAVLLTGGSAFGLDAAAGVMRWCEERGIGVKFGGSVVPIVPAAVIFDLPIGRRDARPDADAGYSACEAASPGRVREGSVGAGTGATVARAGGPGASLKGGIGTASARLPGGVVIGALVVVNAVGEVVDSATGAVIAGPRDLERGGFRSTYDLIREGTSHLQSGTNTTIGVVATNARLSKEQANRLATLGHDGIARAVRPAHTSADGDTLFALATAAVDLPERGLRACEAFAPVVVERAIVKAVRAAKALAGVPSAADWLAKAPSRG